MRAFSEILDEHLKRIGLTPITAAERFGLNRDAIRSVMRGRSPSIERAFRICEAVGLECYIGPPRAAPGESGDMPKKRDPPERIGIAAVRDRRIAAAFDALAEAYDEHNEYGRDALLARFWAAYPELNARSSRNAGGGVSGMAGS